GKKHHHEFSLLEWYRLQWDEHRLMDEVIELLRQFLPEKAVTRQTYGDLFFGVLGVNPYEACLDTLKNCVANHIDITINSLSYNDCLDVLFSHCIEPTLSDITLVY